MKKKKTGDEIETGTHERVGMQIDTVRSNGR